MQNRPDESSSKLSTMAAGWDAILDDVPAAPTVPIAAPSPASSGVRPIATASPSSSTTNGKKPTLPPVPTVSPSARPVTEPNASISATHPRLAPLARPRAADASASTLGPADSASMRRNASAEAVTRPEPAAGDSLAELAHASAPRRREAETPTRPDNEVVSGVVALEADRAAARAPTLEAIPPAQPRSEGVSPPRPRTRPNAPARARTSPLALGGAFAAGVIATMIFAKPFAGEPTAAPTNAAAVAPAAVAPRAPAEAATPTAATPAPVAAAAPANANTKLAEPTPTPPTAPAPAAAPPIDPTPAEPPTPSAPAPTPAAIEGTGDPRAVPPDTHVDAAEAFAALPVLGDDRAPIGGIGRSGVHVDRAEVGRSARHGLCEATDGRYSLADDDKIYLCLRVVHTNKPERVAVLWRRDGNTVRRSLVHVPANHAHRTRVQMSLKPEYVGPWEARFQSEDGTDLGGLTFSVGP